MLKKVDDEAPMYRMVLRGRLCELAYLLVCVLAVILIIEALP